MSPEEQAKSLAEWLERHPGTEPPAGLDPDVVEAVYALRPDLAPAPRVSADDILASVTVGPLADAPAPGPVPAAEPTEQPAEVVVLHTRRRWAAWAGGATAGVLAMAAAAALFVSVNLSSSEPDLVAAEQSVREEADGEVASGKEYEAVADLDGAEALDTGVLAGDRQLAAAPSAKPALSDPEPPPARASRPATRPMVASAPRPAPKPAPAPVPRPSPVAPPVTTGSSADYGAVADVGDEFERDVRIHRARDEDLAGLAKSESQVAAAEVPPEPEAEPEVAIADAELSEEEPERLEVEETLAPPPAPPGDATAGYYDADDSVAEVDEVQETVAVERRRPFRIRLGGRKDQGTPASEVMAPEEPAAAAVDLDALRLAAIPPELPETELMNRNAVPETTRQSVATWNNEGRYAQSADALAQHVGPPIDLGQTNAAQATNLYRMAGEDTKALATARQGLDLSMNTPEAAWLLVYSGDALRAQGDTSGAEVAYREAIRMNESRNAPALRRDMPMEAGQAPPDTTSAPTGE